jgi:hypothetical protein
MSDRALIPGLQSTTTNCADSIDEHLRAAHQRAEATPIAELAAHLQAVLGPAWTAYLAGIPNAKTVGKWARGTRVPGKESERNLRDAAAIVLLIESMEDAATARAWFAGTNPMLSNRAPAWALINLADGRDLVLEAALAFIASGS